MIGGVEGEEAWNTALPHPDVCYVLASVIINVRSSAICSVDGTKPSSVFLEWSNFMHC